MTSGQRAPHITVITRLTTQNAGNEALSSLLLTFLMRRLPHAEVRVLDRTPAQFQQFRFARLGRSSDEIVRNFDRLAARLATAATPAGPLAPHARADLVVLERSGRTTAPWLRELKHAIGFRRHLTRVGLYQSGAFAKTLNTIAWSDVVIWNPAGELHPGGNLDGAFRLLLLVRIAQVLGCRTAVVNQSIEVTDPALDLLIRHVYRRAAFVSVREEPSYRAGLAMGLEPGQLVEIPDFAFLISADEREQPPALDDAVPLGAIALALNGLQARRGRDEWEALFEGLGRFGHPLVVLSNAIYDDVRFARRYAAAHRLKILGRQPSSKELVTLYAGCGALVSSRLHAAIFALSAGVPVITLEPQVHKLAGIFEKLRYPAPTESFLVPGWSERVVARVDEALRDRRRFVEAGKQAVVEQIKRIESSYAPLLALAGAERASSDQGEERRGEGERDTGSGIIGHA